MMNEAKEVGPWKDNQILKPKISQEEILLPWEFKSTPIPQEAKDLIKGSLRFNPNNRIRAIEMQEHPYLLALNMI